MMSGGFLGGIGQRMGQQLPHGWWEGLRGSCCMKGEAPQMGPAAAPSLVGRGLGQLMNEGWGNGLAGEGWLRGNGSGVWAAVQGK